MRRCVHGWGFPSYSISVLAEHVASVILAENSRLFQVVFIAQSAHRGRGEFEQASVACRQP
jgi:hypothetical protein